METSRTDGGMLVLGPLDNGGLCLWIVDAVLQHQLPQAEVALVAVELAGKIDTALQQGRILPHAIIDNPIFDHAPGIANTPAVDHQAMLIPQMLDHVPMSKLLGATGTGQRQFIYDLVV